MCLSCYQTVDRLLADRDPQKMKHYVFLMVNDGVNPTRRMERATVPCGTALEDIVAYVTGRTNLKVDDSGISPTLKLRIIKISPQTPNYNITMWTKAVVKGIEKKFKSG
jgi:hypothetical protein